SAYGALAATTRTGYTFAGWFTAATGGTQVTDVATVTAAANHTLYAHWTANTYTVTFDAQSGTAPSPASKSVTYASAYGALAATTRTGYTFAGWFTAATGGTQVTDVATVTAAANHTLYAHWTANTYTVTFDAQSGTAPSPASKSVTYASAYGTLASTTRAGYTFAGWFTAATGGTQVTEVTTVTASADHTLYAHWTANAYTVTFDAQSGAAPSPASKSVTYASAYGALASTTRAGYTFAGWFTAATGGTQVTEVTAVTASADHTLYAHWTANAYTVTFDAQSGTAPSPASKSVTYASAYGALAATTRTGYTFAGWFTAGTGGTQVTEVTTVTASADHTLYAHWTANTYTVTFDAQSGTAPIPASKSVTYASAYGALAATTRTGYTFAGWFTAATGGTQVTDVTTVTASADHTLCAHWTANNTVTALQFTVGTNSGSRNLQVLVPVQVNQFTNISSFQFSLHWNTAVATYVGVEQFGVPGLVAGNFGTTLTSSGILTVSWDDPAGLCKSVTNGTTLFAVRVLLVGSPGACGPVTIDGTQTAIEAANCDFATTPVETIAGQLCMSPAVLVAGKLTYYAPPTNAAGVGGVTMSLTGDTNQSTQTPADGTYSFTVNAGSSCTLTPGKLNDTPAANGVTTLDISLIRRHILGIATLDSPYKLLAADVNCSGSASTVDISLIRRIILGITNVFPCGLWRFVPAAYVFPDPLSPWSAPGSSGYTNTLADHTNENFVAIKLGDVNNSWTPPAG
ncbi:MAG: InlB B-repeat-containing protein, partial [Verrucomicrobiota bacterium]